MTVICSQCKRPVGDHLYQVQRRRIRALTEQVNGEPVNYAPDLANPWHAGIVVGPEYDDYCDGCFDKLPTIDELFDAYKKRLGISVAPT